jgi:hypothetical protein
MTKNADPYAADLSLGSEFLLSLFQRGVGYSCINTARSALSIILKPIDGYDFGKHPIIKRVLKGIFRERPALPRYTVTYDSEKILSFLKALPKWDSIPLKWLTFKMVTLLAILSGHRCQTLNTLSLDCMDLRGEGVTFYIPNIIKNTTPSFHAKPLKFPSYAPDELICPVRNVVEYIKATAKVRKSRSLIISYSTLTGVTTPTIRRYVVTTLDAAGIDVKTFTAHSTRHAASSGKSASAIPLKDILSAGGWKSGITFRKFYNLPIR